MPPGDAIPLAWLEAMPYARFFLDHPRGSPTMTSPIGLKAKAWADSDPDASTASEVRALLEKHDERELADRFGTSLEFGTAGLRGVIGGGTNRMNRAVIRRTTLGLARYLKATVPDVANRGVVVGRDGRHMSAEFAADTVLVLAAEGIPAHVFTTFAPTPLTAFGVTHLNAAAIKSCESNPKSSVKVSIGNDRNARAE